MAHGSWQASSVQNHSRTERFVSMFRYFVMELVSEQRMSPDRKDY